MRMVTSLFKPFLYFKFLLLQLTQKEIKARYKQSIIGYFWILLNPLAQLIVYSFVFSVVFRFPTNDVPYPIFLLAGLLPWLFFHNSLTASTTSLVENASLLRKVMFPREVIIYSVILAKAVDFAFTCLLFLFLAVIFRAPLAITAWIFFPLFLVQFFLLTGLALLSSAFNLFFRDVQYLINLVLMIWMYLTPIVYPLSLVPENLVWMYKLNPLVGLIEGYRAALFGYPFEHSIIWWSVGISFGIFVIGFTVFKRLEKQFADIA